MIQSKKIKNNCKSLLLINVPGTYFRIAILPTIEFVKRIQHFRRIQKALMIENPSFRYIVAQESVFLLLGGKMDASYEFVSDNVLFSSADFLKDRRDFDFQFHADNFAVCYDNWTVYIPYDAFKI